MKLNPPGSSSDLEAARAIARRLHQRAFASQTESTAVSPPPEPPQETPPARRPAPPPLPTRPAAPSVVRPTRSAAPPVVRPAPPPDPELQLESPPPAVESEQPPWSEPSPRRPAWTEEPEPEASPQIERHGHERWEADSPAAHARESAFADDVDQDVEGEEPAAALAGLGRSAAEEDLEDDALANLTGEGPVGADLEDMDDLATGAPSLDEDDVGIEEPSFDESGLEAPSFGVPAPGEVDDGLDLEAPPSEAPAYEPQAYEEAPFEEPAPSAGEVSPEDLIGGPSESPEAWLEEAPLDPEIGTGTAEDLVEVAPPSWDDVADTCLAQAGGRGAMLVAASGQVLSARGDWPNPGPEAIAGRLVAMMERALRDAPTRSVSAPLAGQHLTAWRVPVADGLLTAVFIGDAPLKADVRPAIDDEIRRAGGV